MKRIVIVFFLATAAAFSGCRHQPIVVPVPDQGTLVIQVQPTAPGGQAFQLNKFYMGADSQEYTINLFRAYLSNIRLVKNDNSEVKALDVALIDFGPASTTPADSNTVGSRFTFKVPIGSYKAVKMGLGVYKALNTVKQDYPNNHPLSVYRGTDWSWAGYRFIMLEGKVKNRATGAPEAFEYHTATDTFYREMNFFSPLTIDGNDTKTLNLKIDIDKIFSPEDAQNKVDMLNEPYTHVENAQQANLAWRITENMKAAMTLE